MNTTSYSHYRQKRQHGTAEFPVVYFPSDHMLPRDVITLHWHPESELIHVLSGQMQLFVNRTTHTLSEGDFFFLSEGQLHSADISGCVCEHLVFSSKTLFEKWPLCQKEREQIDSHHLFLKPLLSENQRLSDICTRIFLLLHPTDPFLFTRYQPSSDGYDIASLPEEELPPGATLELLGLLYQLFGTLFSEHYYTESTEGTISVQAMEKLKNALTYIEDHYSETITLDGIAHAAGFNTRYLCRIFKDATLLTPVEYLNQFRINQAALLLLTTKSSVTDIAFQCGFHDTSYFIRQFKRAKSKTPTAYRHETVPIPF